MWRHACLVCVTLHCSFYSLFLLLYPGSLVPLIAIFTCPSVACSVYVYSVCACQGFFFRRSEFKIQKSLFVFLAGVFTKRARKKGWRDTISARHTLTDLLKEAAPDFSLPAGIKVPSTRSGAHDTSGEFFFLPYITESELRHLVSPWSYAT